MWFQPLLLWLTKSKISVSSVILYRCLDFTKPQTVIYICCRPCPIKQKMSTVVVVVFLFFFSHSEQKDQAQECRYGLKMLMILFDAG